MIQDPLVLDVLFIFHVGKRLISGVKLCVVVPQAIGISLRNRIGDSAGDVPCFYLGFACTMGLILLTCSLFLPVSVLHVIVCSSIDTPLNWFDPWPAFYYYLLCIHRFLAKSRVHTRIFGQKSRTYAVVLYIVAYILPFGESDVVGISWVVCECGWVFLGSEVVCWMLLL